MTERATDAPPWTDTLREMVIIGTACLVFCGAGALLAWPAAALPHLTTVSLSSNPNATRPPLSSTQASWIVAALHAGQVLGAAPGALLASRIGRRAALLWCAPPMVGAWLLLATAGDGGDGGAGVLALLVTGRVVGGVAVGAAFAAGPLYAAEAASARLRGAAGALVQLALSVGQLLVYCGGAWLSLRVLALAAGVLPVVFVVAFWWAPESPHWLLRKGCEERAEEALRTLRGSNATKEQIKAELNALEAYKCSDTLVKREEIMMSVRKRKSVAREGPNTIINSSVTNEIEENMNGNIRTEPIVGECVEPEIINEAEESKETTMENSTTTEDGPSKKKAYLRGRTFRQVLRLIYVLVLLQSFGAACFVFPYPTHVLDGAPLSSEMGLVVLGSVQVIGALTSLWLLTHIGRRPALLTSTSVAGIAWAARVICLYLLPCPTAAFVLLLVAVFAYSLAFSSVPLLCAAELTPPSARVAVVTTATALFAAGSYSASKAYGALWHADRPFVVSFMSAAACGAAAWLTSAQMPEARGLNLSQVQQRLKVAFSGPAPLAAKRLSEGNTGRSEQPPPAPKRIVVFQVHLWKLGLVFMRDAEIKEDTEGNNTTTHQVQSPCDDRDTMQQGLEG